MEKKQYFIVDENGDVKDEFFVTEGVLGIIFDEIDNILSNAE